MHGNMYTKYQDYFNYCIGRGYYTTDKCTKLGILEK